MNNTKYFENPTEFNIDRWDKELKEPFSFTPFSAGPRHCIGQHLAILEAKIIIGVVLKNYELEKIAGKAPKLVAKILYEFQDDNLVKFLKMK